MTDNPSPRRAVPIQGGPPHVPSGPAHDRRQGDPCSAASGQADAVGPSGPADRAESPERADAADRIESTGPVPSCDPVTTPPRAGAGGQERFRALFEDASAGVALSELDGRFCAANPALHRLLDGSGIDAAADGLADLVRHLPAGSDEARAWSQGLDAVRTGRVSTARVELSIAPLDAAPRWVRATAALVVLGDHRYLLTHLEDTTDRRSAEQRVVELTLHDGLTQLAGRTLVCDRLGAALTRAGRTGLPVGVLHVDLDDVARVNTVLGERVGDTVLVGLAQRLAGLVRAGDTAGRVGGCQFVVVAPDVLDASALNDLAHRVSAALAAPLDVARARLLVTVNVGAVLARPGDDVATVLLSAAAAAHEVARARPQARVDLGERITRLPDEPSPADRPH